MRPGPWGVLLGRRLEERGSRGQRDSGPLVGHLTLTLTPRAAPPKARRPLRAICCPAAARSPARCAGRRIVALDDRLFGQILCPPLCCLRRGFTPQAQSLIS